MHDDPTNDTFDEIVRNTELDQRLARLSARADRTRPAASSRTNVAASSTKRRSAARGSRRAALGLSAVSTIGLAGWMWSATATTSTNLAAATPIAATGTATSASSSSSSGTAAATTATTVAAASTSSASTAASTSTSSTSSLHDGTYTGASTSTRYGAVQVQITVSGGRITAVTVPAYPSNDNRSASINATAVPKLVSATLTAQSASVSNVSGATYTTNGYRTSLQSAIDASRAAS